MSNSMSSAILLKQLKNLTKNPVDGCSVGLVDESNLFEWEIYMTAPEDTLYEGGCFRATMEFPEDYPYSPPKLVFRSEMWHPNVYEDGKVCISILHPPVEEFGNTEDLSEKWSPVQTVETVLISVRSLFADPNCSSAANVDASVEFRNNLEAFTARVKALVDKSIAELPEGFVVPSSGPIVTAVREDSAQSIENWTYEESSYSDEGEGEEVVINEVDMDDAGSSSS